MGVVTSYVDFPDFQLMVNINNQQVNYDDFTVDRTDTWGVVRDRVSISTHSLGLMYPSKYSPCQRMSARTCRRVEHHTILNHRQTVQSSVGAIAGRDQSTVRALQHIVH